MEQIIEVCVQNGLGVCSFVALLYFIFYYVNDINETMKSINTTQIQMQISMEKLADRIDKIEEKMKNEII